MKQSQIQIGRHYECKVSGRLVIVKAARRVDVLRGSQYRTKFICRRVDNGRELPKARSAASFRREIKPPEESSHERDVRQYSNEARNHIINGHDCEAGLYARLAAGHARADLRARGEL